MDYDIHMSIFAYLRYMFKVYILHDGCAYRTPSMLVYNQNRRVFYVFRNVLKEFIFDCEIRKIIYYRGRHV